MYIEDEAVVKENVEEGVEGESERGSERGKTRRALTRQRGLYSARRPSLCPTLPIPTTQQSLLQCNPHKKAASN